MAFVNLVGKVSDNDTTARNGWNAIFFKLFIWKRLQHFKPKTSFDQEATRQPSKKNEALTKCNFNDMKIIQPLGAGGFGLVKLVRVAAVPDKTFALKCIQKVTYSNFLKIWSIT